MKLGGVRMVFSTILLSAVVLASAQHTGKVEGLTVVTNSDAVIAKLREGFSPGMAFEDLHKLFKDEDFVLTAWGKRSAVLIDRAAGPLGDFKLQLEIADALAKKMGSDLTFKLGDLDSSGSNPASDFLQQFFRPERFEGGKSAINGFQVGLEVKVNFTVEGKDGKRVTVPVPTSSETTEKRRATLLQHPLPPRKELSENEINAMNRASKASVRKAPDELAFHYVGIARSAVPDAQREASKEVEELIASLEGQVNEASQSLLKKFGLKGGTLPAGDVALKDLPKDLQDKLFESFTGNWKMGGFADKLEAETFFLNSRSLVPSTSMGLMICERAGGGGNPSSFGTFFFSNFAGGIAP